MLGLADALRSFPPATFGVRAEDDARLAAGALVWATGVLVDHLFEDVQTLAEEDTTVAECDSPLWHLEALPARYALQYDSLFARRFLVTVIALTTRFTDGTFRRLSCVAEELALKLLLDEARVTLETFGLLGDDVSTALETFADTVHEDMDHTWLYDDSLDGIDESPVGNALGVRPLRFKEWFTPSTRADTCIRTRRTTNWTREAPGTPVLAPCATGFASMTPIYAVDEAQRRPAKRSFSGTAAPVVSWTRRKVSTPINSPNLSLPIRRKKMFSP